jgi:hypothetical protein
MFRAIAACDYRGMEKKHNSPELIRGRIQKHKTAIKRLQIVLRLAELDRHERAQQAPEKQERRNG